ncbi:MAG: DUF1295 domain-containing protein [Phaeodactylibacter sp.]|nr:DUF1295 domain-containing protein [Phaeodactylibacter sp.]MCB9272775.1 DUF1295 domain-containing protein [Lewinellaceae bacterium]
MINTYLDSAVLIFIYMNLIFLLALWKRDNSIVDIGWGPGFALVAWWMHIYYPHLYSWLPATLVSIWGLRLAIYIGRRNARKGGEDWRYAKWREEWGKWVIPRAYLQVFLLQGFFMWIIALPMMQRPAGVGLEWYQWAGVALWLAGFLWETIADWQLARFKLRPENEGRLMMYGLWRLSRHPNYFGEIVLWWGLWLLMLPYGLWYISLFSPLSITWLLVRVSGVPMLERRYEGNLVYEAYQKRTPALAPKMGKWKPGAKKT